MLEPRTAYLRRLLPDLNRLLEEIEEADTTDQVRSDFYTLNAIGHAEKLLEDLERALAATV